MPIPTDPELLRIRGYLQSQAAKLDLPALVEKVRSDSTQLRDAATAALAVPALKRPRDGEWSVNEVLAHLYDTCRDINRGIVAAALEGTRPGPLTDALQETDEAATPPAWFDRIAAEREQMFATIGPLAGSEHPEVSWDHPMFGPLTWREWVLFLRIHDLDHARQVQGIVAALS